MDHEGELVTLPPFTDLPALSYGPLTPDFCVIHVSQNNSGLSVANYCLSNPNGYRWHWTVGQDGTAWKHLDYNEEGAHDAGLNQRSIGIEHAGYCKPLPNGVSKATTFSANIAQLSASAQIVADFAHYLGKSPSRDWIIGHEEDAKYGGTSTHQDPGEKWPWDDYMAMVKFYYAGGDDMALAGQEQDALAYIWGQQRKAQGGGRPTAYDPKPDALDSAQAGWDDQAAEIAHRASVPGVGHTHADDVTGAGPVIQP